MKRKILWRHGGAVVAFLVGNELPQKMCIFVGLCANDDMTQCQKTPIWYLYRESPGYVHDVLVICLAPNPGL